MKAIQQALRFCLVVPMYNEKVSAELCVRRLCGTLQALSSDAALIVINDGSQDATGEILGRLVPEFPNLVVVAHDVNAGYGGAIRTGIEKAAQMKFEYALFMDSDLTNDPKYISSFVEKMQAGFDVIKASRYVKGGRAVGVPLHRVIISVVGNTVSRVLFRVPITDCTNGFQAVKVDMLKRMLLSERGFAVIMEELYYAKHFEATFAEVPYTLTARSEDVRKSSFYYRPKVFYQYFKYGLKSFLRIAPRFRPISREDRHEANSLSRM